MIRSCSARLPYFFSFYHVLQSGHLRSGHVTIQSGMGLIVSLNRSMDNRQGSLVGVPVRGVRVMTFCACLSTDQEDTTSTS